MGSQAGFFVLLTSGLLKRVSVFCNLLPDKSIETSEAEKNAQSIYNHRRSCADQYVKVILNIAVRQCDWPKRRPKMTSSIRSINCLSPVMSRRAICGFYI